MGSTSSKVGRSTGLSGEPLGGKHKLTYSIGAVIGFLGNFLNERVYRAKAPVKGVDARLYAPMFAGVFFAGGCFITGFTSISSVHWIAPCIGLAMLLGKSPVPLPR